MKCTVRIEFHPTVKSLLCRYLVEEEQMLNFVDYDANTFTLEEH